MQYLCAGGDTCDLYFEVGGAISAGMHTNGDNSGGNTDSTFLLTQCKAGQSVLVKVGASGAYVYGTFNNMKTAVFTGTVLSLS